MSGQAVTMGTGEWGRLDGRDNALNFVRLALAATVLLKHAVDARAGAASTPTYLGPFAVDGFFAISGYLIASSRSRLSFGTFMWRRALRLLPGLWVALAVTAFVFSPVVAAARGLRHEWWQALTYVLNNGALVMTQHTIGDTPAPAPLDHWNLSLWTLPYEAGAYVAFGLLLTSRQFGRRAAVATCAAMTISVLAVWTVGVPALDGVVRLGSFFAAGVALWYWRERLPSSGWLAVGAAVAALALNVTSYPLYEALAPLPVAYLMLWLGANLPTRIGATNDLSYGLYVHAFPVTQLLLAFGVGATLGAVGFVALVLVFTVPLAAASWRFVERPALRLRRHSSRVIPATTVHDPSSNLTFSGLDAGGASTTQAS